MIDLFSTTFKRKRKSYSNQTTNNNSTELSAVTIVQRNQDKRINTNYVSIYNTKKRNSRKK